MVELSWEEAPLDDLLGILKLCTKLMEERRDTV